MSNPAVVLVGMSVSDLDHRDALNDFARARGASVAFLQMADPSLSAELTRLADAGVQAITIVGIDHGPIAPAVTWIRRIAAYWLRDRAGARPALAVATRLATSIEEIDERLVETRAITGNEPGLNSDAWESVALHRRQVLICRGPRCTAKGATESLRALILEMLILGIGDADALLVHTGCQSPCNQAPVVNVQPDDVWYGKVDPATAARIAREHLARPGGRAVLPASIDSRERYEQPGAPTAKPLGYQHAELELRF